VDAQWRKKQKTAKAAHHRIEGVVMTSPWFLTVALLAALLLVRMPAAATDLRPSLDLPSERSPQSTPVPAFVSPEAFYQKFAADVRTMKADEITKLRNDFLKRLDTARTNSSSNEVRHYQRMLGILASSGR
jgi:hypothetical protein